MPSLLTHVDGHRTPPAAKLLLATRPLSTLPRRHIVSLPTHRMCLRRLVCPLLAALSVSTSARRDVGAMGVGPAVHGLHRRAEFLVARCTHTAIFGRRFAPQYAGSWAHRWAKCRHWRLGGLGNPHRRWLHFLPLDRAHGLWRRRRQTACRPWGVVGLATTALGAHGRCIGRRCIRSMATRVCTRQTRRPERPRWGHSFRPISSVGSCRFSGPCLALS